MFGSEIENLRNWLGFYKALYYSNKKCTFLSKMSLILEIKINEIDHFKAKVLTPSKIKAIKNIQEHLIKNQNQIKMLKASYFRHIIDI